MNTEQHIWLAVLWLIFGFTHSVLAGERIKKAVGILMKDKFRFYRLCYSLFATTLLAYIVYYNFSIPSVLLWKPLLIQKIVAVFLAVAGLIAMAVCIRKYFFDLSGINVFFKQKNVENNLEVNGLNKYVRHPLYTGTLLFVWSFFLWQPLLSNFISCVCILLYTLIGIHYEERRLIKIFGEEYKIYAAKAPMLIPRFL